MVGGGGVAVKVDVGLGVGDSSPRVAVIEGTTVGVAVNSGGTTCKGFVALGTA